MGAGASAAADARLLTICLDSIRTRADEESPSVLIAEMRTTHLAELSQEQVDQLLPVLEAAIEKYLSSRRQGEHHGEAKERAVVTARAMFSSPKPLRPVSQSLETLPSLNSAEGAQLLGGGLAPLAPIESGKNLQEDLAKAATAKARPPDSPARVEPASTAPEPEPVRADPPPRRRGRGRREKTPPPPAAVLACASMSTFEVAEIGGGTTFTTELTLYEDMTCELGSHDVGAQSRQVVKANEGTAEGTAEG
eukprot:CAMPEP_0172601672 /NCGR_PEP_ID=MMETSP1068-20121228/21850_1 /TAXON_ID=35684 /ORGANISM="Pseudopedinella elastica, Strain CCMP716" /LENGTH=250 /DNA_ID=CAMNT_0013402751 /DNA_START=103 /DNA_END=851 /DNA_ORIENTATION=-